MNRHRIRFRYSGTEDDGSIQLAFDKSKIADRKNWLTNFTQERKRRRELGLPEPYLYGKDTRAITYHDFVHKELVLFSNLDNERSIPSVVDGLKPGQRKVSISEILQIYNQCSSGVSSYNYRLTHNSHKSNIFVVAFVQFTRKIQYVYVLVLLYAVNIDRRYS